jgi:small-conductance mechanosensitive channel/CRP-like cAMP-binding protein
MLLAEGSFLQIAIVFLIVAIAALLARSDRRTLLGVATLYVVSIILHFASGYAIRHRYLEAGKFLDVLSLTLLGVSMLNLAATIIFAIILRTLRLEPARIIRDLVVAFAYIAFAFFLFSHYQVDLTGVIATSAVITAVVGFSLQDMLSNVMGGVALQLDRSIAPGDWIKVGDVSGIVREISWRRVSIETRNGDQLLLPNSQIMKSQVLVQGRLWNGERRQRRWVYFQVDARHTPTRVIDIVTEALNRENIPRVAAEPAPHVVLMDLKDGLGNYAVRYWLTDVAADDLTDSSIRTRLFYALERASIPLGIPQSSLLLHRSSDQTSEQPAPEIDSRLAALRSVTIFRALTPEELSRVAEQLIWAPFAPGETILVQGSVAHYLYILTRGRVEVRLTEEGVSSKVAEMEAPNFMGEGGMLTGARRSASIIALTEVECWRLHKDGFQQIIQSRPEIVEEISKVLAQRRVELTAVREGLTEEATRQRMEAEQKTLVTRIRNFFSV